MFRPTMHFINFINFLLFLFLYCIDVNHSKQHLDENVHFLLTFNNKTALLVLTFDLYWNHVPTKHVLAMFTWIQHIDIVLHHPESAIKPSIHETFDVLGSILLYTAIRVSHQECKFWGLACRNDKFFALK